MNQDYEVFISYRHKDCNELAKALHKEFTNMYSVDVFRDEEELHFGDFRKQLVRNNRKSKYLLLLLTPGMLDRCKNEGDWITAEISMFLEKGKTIIPVKMNGFDYPEDIPDSIKGLLDYDANSIVCDFNDPGLTAKYIAYETYNKIRNGWSEESRREAIEQKAYLSRFNRSAQSHYYDTAINLRKYIVLFIFEVALLCFAIGNFNQFRTTDPYTIWETLVLLFGPLSGLIILFDKKQMCSTNKICAGNIPCDKCPHNKSYIDIILEEKITTFIGSLIKLCLIWYLPFVLISTALGALSVAAGGFILGKGLVKYALPIAGFVLLVLIPFVRILYKMIESAVEFIFCLVLRYPTNYLACNFMNKYKRKVRFWSWFALLPALVLAGILGVLMAEGGF